MSELIDGVLSFIAGAVQVVFEIVSWPAAWLTAMGAPVPAEMLGRFVAAAIVNGVGWFVIVLAGSLVLHLAGIALQVRAWSAPAGMGLVELRRRAASLMLLVRVVDQLQVFFGGVGDAASDDRNDDLAALRRRALGWRLRLARIPVRIALWLPRTLAGVLHFCGYVLRNPYALCIGIASLWWAIGSPDLSPIVHEWTSAAARVAPGITIVTLASLAAFGSMFLMVGWGPRFHGRMQWHRTRYEAAYEQLDLTTRLAMEAHDYLVEITSLLASRSTVVDAVLESVPCASVIVDLDGEVSISWSRWRRGSHHRAHVPAEPLADSAARLASELAAVQDSFLAIPPSTRRRLMHRTGRSFLRRAGRTGSRIQRSVASVTSPLGGTRCAVGQWQESYDALGQELDRLSRTISELGPGTWVRNPMSYDASELQRQLEQIRPVVTDEATRGELEAEINDAAGTQAELTNRLQELVDARIAEQADAVAELAFAEVNLAGIAAVTRQLDRPGRLASLLGR